MKAVIVENKGTNYSRTIKYRYCFNLNNCTYKIIENYSPDKLFARCQVTSSVNPNIAIDLEENVDYVLIHREVKNLLNSIIMQTKLLVCSGQPSLPTSPAV